jgi:uncharacterized protein involved in response to NO
MAAHGHPLWGLGFRPFFLAAGSFAAIAMLLWSGIWFGGWRPAAVAPVYWHAHEMIYGYALAVVAGFLLTAVRNWTGLPTPSGSLLVALVACWFVARVALLLGPAALMIAAGFDLLFNAALLVAVARPIVRVRQWRQGGILAKLVLLSAGNAVFYLGAMDRFAEGVFYALHGGVLLLVALILTMAGRVLPGFIERGVRKAVKLRDPRWASAATLVLFLGFFVAELFVRDARLAAFCAAGLAGVTTWRLVAWHTVALWREPLLWGLYLAVFSIAGGFVLYACAPWWPIPRALALHALAAGGIGLATLAMMARVALGHTGRDIRKPPASVGVALGLLAAGVLVRVGLPLVLPLSYGVALACSQALWIAAFTLFVVTYAPILMRARADDVPG